MRWGSAVTWVAVLAVLGLLGFGLTRDANELPSPLVGNPAPGFELIDLEGDTVVSLAALEGRPVVVNFWASWCLGCIEEHPALVRAWRRFETRGVMMVGVVYQDSPANARRYLTRHGGGWPQLVDPGSRAAIDYGVYGIPETFFVGRDGIIAHKHIGPVTDSVMATEIRKILAAGATEGVPEPEPAEALR